jgi:hypothetical protein
MTTAMYGTTTAATMNAHLAYPAVTTASTTQTVRTPIEIR